MKLSAILILAACLQVAARSEGQTVTISVKDAPMKQVFRQIQKQTGLNIMIRKSLLEQAGKVTLNVRDMPVSDVLNLCFKEQALAYTIEGDVIVVQSKPTVVLQPADNPPPAVAMITVKGRITNESNEPIQASIVVKGTQNGTTSNVDGYFELTNIDEKATLLITGVSIEPQEIKVNSRVTINITAVNKIKEGEEVVVAYNKISTRSNVGAVTVIKGEQIQNLPNRSFDKSLQGLVPGLLITQGTGQPGGGVSNFVLRGIATGAYAGSRSTARNPLIVVDGVPVFQDVVEISSGAVTSNNLCLNLILPI